MRLKTVPLLLFLGGAAAVTAASGAFFRHEAIRLGRALAAKLENRAVARTRLAPIPFGPDKLRIVEATANRPRLLLDERTLERIRDQARRNTIVWQRVRTRCDEYVRAAVPSGYQGFDWADAMAATALCWHATGDRSYAQTAIQYLDALTDDRLKVGDHQGGATVVRHDSGYGIRTFGAYSALGYDWLRHAPDMTPALRAKVLARLDAWLSWYKTDGYLNNEPISNYFWGYLTALSFAGLAAAGDNPKADEWLERARTLLTNDVLPTFNAKLTGGGWPEGWQYGQYVAAEVALVARAFQTATGVRLIDKLPWLKQAVKCHIHLLLPDGATMYDGGTWGEHPARPSALAMTAAAIALDGIDDVRAQDARWLSAVALPPLRRESVWMSLLAAGPLPARDIRVGEPTSFHDRSTGLSLMRSDWSKSAVFTSFQAGPWLTPDHQDKDQGHFELWRGSDALLVDGGDTEGSATINHNTLLIDDHGRHMTYTPNQGVWGFDVKTTRFGDDGQVVVALGDIGQAYAPSCAPEGCPDRSVEKLMRTFVYVRPSLVVIRDDIALEQTDYGARWAAHVTRPARVAGTWTSAVIGGSRVDIQTIEPANARVVILKEPSGSGEGPHRMNQPWGPMWRIEVSSPTGDKHRAFLNWITAGDARDKPAAAQRVAGSGLSGVAGRSGDAPIAVLFARDEHGGTAEIPSDVTTVVVAALKPGDRYDIVASGEQKCQLRVTESARGTPAGPGGFLRVPGCASGRAPPGRVPPGHRK